MIICFNFIIFAYYNRKNIIIYMNFTPVLPKGLTPEGFTEGLSEKAVAGDLTKGLSGKIPGLNFLSTAKNMSKNLKNIKNPLQNFIDKDCATNAYGQLILDDYNKEHIKKTATSFVNEIFNTSDEKPPIISKKDIIDETRKLFFNQLRTSIWEDYHIKHMLVYTMITNPQDFNQLGGKLSDAFTGITEPTDVNINTIFNKFMEKLHEYVTSSIATPIMVGGRRKKSIKGGDNTDIDPDKIQIAEKISSWYKPNSDKEIINDKILYIIQNAIKEALNEKEARKNIYNAITKVFEEQIKSTFTSDNGDDLLLKFYILYKLLKEDNILIQSFKGAIKHTLEKLKEQNKLELETTDIQTDLTTYIQKYFEEFFKKVFINQPTRKPYNGGKRRKSKSKKRISKKRTTKKNRRIL